MRSFNQGDIVRHFKRELNDEANQYLYQIIGIGIDSETQKEVMIYKALYGDQRIYVRDLEMFLSKVDKEKYPQIKQRYRFEKVN